jgi:predicted TIM-barrel fold metal-dependent hydrolase
MSELALVDAHHHLWETAVRDYPWMDGAWVGPIRGRFDATRYAELTKPYGVRESIVVQALADVGETYDLLSVADAPAELTHGSGTSVGEPRLRKPGGAPELRRRPRPEGRPQPRRDHH